MVGWAKPAFDCNREIVGVDGFEVLVRGQQRVAEAVPGGEGIGVRLEVGAEVRDGGVRRADLVEAKRELVQGRFILRLLVHRFAQTADGAVPFAEVFVFEGDFEQQLLLHLVVGPFEGFAEVLDRQAVFLHLAVHAAQRGPRLVVRGFQGEHLAQDRNGLHMLSAVGQQLGRAQLKRRISREQLLRILQHRTRLAFLAVLHVKVQQAVQLVRVEEFTGSAGDHALEAAR